MNNNTALIESLRMAADWLEQRPDFPKMGKQHLTFSVATKKDAETLVPFGSWTIDGSGYTTRAVQQVAPLLAIDAYLPSRPRVIEVDAEVIAILQQGS